MYISRIAFSITKDGVAAFEETAQAVASYARTLPGCIYFELLYSTKEAREYVLYEEWEQKAQADNFKQSGLRRDSISKLSSTMAKPPVVVEHTF